MQGRFVVTVIWCSSVGGEEGQDSSDVRAGNYGEPVNRSVDGLVGGLTFGEVGVVRFRIRYGVYGEAWVVWFHEGNTVTVFEAEAVGGVLSEGLLRDAN